MAVFLLDEISSIVTGTYKGQGQGVYPTINSFSYLEETTITPLPAGKPIFSLQQRTKRVETGEPLHAEQGYLRFGISKDIPFSHDSPQQQQVKVEIILSQPNGLASVEEGTATLQNGVLRLELSSTSLSRASSSRPPAVTQFTRVFIFNKTTGELTYFMDMATDRTPVLTRHLNAKLTKQQ